MHVYVYAMVLCVSVSFAYERGPRPLQTVCPLGAFCDSNGNLIPCPGGTYQNFTGASSISQCLYCPLGSYAGSPGALGAATCAPCPAGTFAPSLGTMTCTNCPAGTYGTVVGANSSSACITCPLGSFCPSGSVSVVRVSSVMFKL